MAAVEEEFAHEFPSSPPVTKEQKLALLIESMKSGGQFDAVVDMCQDILNSFRENEQRSSSRYGDGSRSWSPSRPRPRSAVPDEKGHVKQAVGVIVDTVWRNNVARPSSSPAFSKTRTERNFTTSAAVVADLIQKFGTANPHTSHEAYSSNDNNVSLHISDASSDSHSILWPSAQTLMNTHVEGPPYHTQTHTHAHTQAQEFMANIKTILEAQKLGIHIPTPPADGSMHPRIPSVAPRPIKISPRLYTPSADPNIHQNNNNNSNKVTNRRAVYSSANRLDPNLNQPRPRSEHEPIIRGPRIRPLSSNPSRSSVTSNVTSYSTAKSYSNSSNPSPRRFVFTSANNLSSPLVRPATSSGIRFKQQQQQHIQSMDYSNSTMQQANRQHEEPSITTSIPAEAIVDPILEPTPWSTPLPDSPRNLDQVASSPSRHAADIPSTVASRPHIPLLKLPFQPSPPVQPSSQVMNSSRSYQNSLSGSRPQTAMSRLSTRSSVSPTRGFLSTSPRFLNTSSSSHANDLMYALPSTIHGNKSPDRLGKEQRRLEDWFNHGVKFGTDSPGPCKYEIIHPAEMAHSRVTTLPIPRAQRDLHIPIKIEDRPGPATYQSNKVSHQHVLSSKSAVVASKSRSWIWRGTSGPALPRFKPSAHR
eukprot:GILJ01008998.1.p1 GENE.GILJ01008998.1~~GILJ01008998.1.p1  ORF type:complete len:660 (-),score=68.32 GILJ01008998.1:294-2228(-)